MEIRSLDTKHVAMCRTEQEAMRLCIRRSRVYRTQEHLAEALGMNKGTLNTILNSDNNARPRYLPRVKQVDLQKLCGNRAIDQWAEMYEKGLLNCQRTKAEEIAELEQKLAQLKAG